MLTRAFEFLR